MVGLTNEDPATEYLFVIGEGDDARKKGGQRTSLHAREPKHYMTRKDRHARSKARTAATRWRARGHPLD